MDRHWYSNPTGEKFFAINLVFTTKQYKVDNIVNFVYYGKTRKVECCPFGTLIIRLAVNLAMEKPMVLGGDEQQLFL